MPTPRHAWFSPADAARMSRLQLTARQVVEGMVTGRHKSPHRGFSAEFAEHREYVPGDEIRLLDWQAYARTDRYYIRLHEQETNLRATLVLDTSGSMEFGGKLDYARHLAACLTYLLAMQQDLAGVCAADESVRIELPPASTPQHLDRVFRALESLTPRGQTRLADALHELAERLPRRGLIILISDLWLDADELARALGHLHHRRHQAMVLHLVDQRERTLDYPQRLTLEDMETRQRIQVNPADIREEYCRQVEAHLSQVRAHCTRCHAEHHLLDTAEPYDKALVRLLARRQ